MKDWRPKLSAIEDPIAEDFWSYRMEDGTPRTSRVTIGRPVQLKDGTDWYCPMFFEHVTRGIDCVFGVGPVDALMNAMYFVRRRFYEFDEVTPLAKPPRAATAGTRRPQARKRAASKRVPAKRAAARKPTRRKT
jgi:hypothetical protein